MKEVRFGIIGCGVVGPWHINAIRKVENARLIAVADNVEEKAKKISEEYGVPYYTDYEDLLKRDDIDVVNICLPSGLHKEACIKAAEYKKHIICEKPLEITIPKIRKILEAVEKNKVKLEVIFQRRFFEASKLIKQAIENKKLGKIISGSVYMKYYRTQEYYDSAGWRGTWEMDGGGCLMNQGIHGIDLLQYLVGEVDSVYAHTDTVAHERIEVEDFAVAMVYFKNGAVGVIEGSTSCYPELPTRLEIYGTEGTVILEEYKITRWDFKNPTEEDKKVVDKFKEKEIKESKGDPTARLGDTHLPQIRDMVESILYDRKPAVDGYSATHPVEIILAIYKSAKEKRLVKIEEIRKEG